MRHLTNRWISRLLLAVMAFAHVSVALADCPVDRGTLVRALVVEAARPCESGTMSMTEYGPLYSNRCVAHCTAELRLPLNPVTIVRSAADAPVLVLPRNDRVPAQSRGLEFPAPGTPPPRILLHSFQI